MAKAFAKMPEDFMTAVSSLAERTDDIIPRVLEAGAEVVYAKVKGNLHAAIGRGTKYKSRATGELASALGISPAKLDKDGNYDVKIGFAEPHSGGQRDAAPTGVCGRGTGDISNAMLAKILEYGKHGQPPKPFMKPAKTASRSECIAAMKAKLEQEIGEP